MNFGLSSLFMTHLGVRAPWRNPTALAATVSSNVLALALPLVVLQIYDRIIPNESTSTLEFLLFGMVVAIVLDTLLKLARGFLIGWAGAQYEHDAARGMIATFMRIRLDALEAVPAGQHLDRLSGLEKVRDFYTGPASIALIDAPFVVIFILLIAAIGHWLVLVPLALLGVGVLLALHIGKLLKSAVDDRAQWDDRRYNFIIEALSGLHTIKGLTMERLIERRYERLMVSASQQGQRVAYLSSLAQSTGALISQITLAGIVGCGCLLVVYGDLTIGGLAACTMLAGRTVQPVMRFMGVWARYQGVTSAHEQIDQVSAMPVEVRGQRTMHSFRSLLLEHAAFQYEGAEKPVLADINLSLSPGEAVGITGGNGVGKTTLLQLITGALEPTQGQVLINGCPVSTYGTDSIANHIAYVPQRPVLFNGTVLENITLFQDGERLEDALILAEQLGLDAVFARMPDGYDTRVGDTAASLLPAGVAQRISIARTLVRKPQLILFDEANMSLDADSDTKLRKVLEASRSHAAMILVSFRPSLLRIADHRLTLSHGALIDPSSNIILSMPAQ